MLLGNLQSNGEIVNKTNSLLGEMVAFYTNLYKSKDISNENVDRYLENIDVPEIKNDDKNILNKFPSYSECSEAVFQMKNNKSPGIDGLPSEFYQCFWTELGPIFFAALKEIFEQGELTNSQKLSIISLLFKKDERNLLKNYRPISLTNTDYKIIAFIFAKRLQTILSKVINKNQTAYVKGRYIGENARLILDIFDYCNTNNKAGILLFLDFEKAFDSVEWNFLFKVLIKFNVGDNFMKWMKILYKNPKFKIKNNGWLSKQCSMSRGIRQGCPISAMLYLFVAKMLALKI